MEELCSQEHRTHFSKIKWQANSWDKQLRTEQRSRELESQNTHPPLCTEARSLGKRWRTKPWDTNSKLVRNPPESRESRGSNARVRGPRGDRDLSSLKSLNKPVLLRHRIPGDGDPGPTGVGWHKQHRRLPCNGHLCYGRSRGLQAQKRGNQNLPVQITLQGVTTPTSRLSSRHHTRVQGHQMPLTRSGTTRRTWVWTLPLKSCFMDGGHGVVAFSISTGTRGTRTLLPVDPISEGSEPR